MEKSITARHVAELSAENTKLREQIHWLKQGDILHVLTDQEYIDQCQRERLMQVSIDALDKENDKLRELVRDMWGCISHIGEYDVFYYDMAKDGCGISCTVNGEHCCADKLHYRMRELGVEDGHDERVIAHVNSEKREEPDYLCDMCSNDCDERKTIRVGQSAYDVCEKWQEAEE